MRKKVGPKIRPQRPGPLAASWAVHRGGETEPLKRLTIDIPSSLHTRIKSQCALRGTKMAEEIRVLLEAAYPKLG